MPANKYALLRYRIIDRCLNSTSYPFPKKEDLRQACEDALFGSTGDHISESTIEKDIWAMRNEGDLGYYAPIAYHPGEKGYYYEEEDYSINNLSLNDNDLEAITLAAATLDQFRDIPIFNEFGSAIDKVVQRVNLSPQGSHAHIQFETANSQAGTEHLGPLLKAIEKRQTVEISYQKFTTTDPKLYAIHPYLLKEYKSRWYLICWEPKRKDYLTFGLERMKKCSVSDKKFDYQSSFDPDRFFMHSIGITELDAKPTTVRLQISTLQSKYLDSRPIHPSQRKEKETKDGVVFNIKVVPTYELVQWILSMGKDCVVLEPSSLKDEVRNHLTSTIKHYA